MPGYANWEQLYREEYAAMSHEGFDVTRAVLPQNGEQPLPFPVHDPDDLVGYSEAYWEKAYQSLWDIRERGVRQDYPYVEPINCEEILLAADKSPNLPKISVETYEKRIAGAVYGRFAGVVLGKPLEMNMNRTKIKEYLESVGEYPLSDYVSGYSSALDMHLREDCIPSTRGHISYVQPDDDIHYTILALLLVEKHGMEFSSADVGNNWLDNIPYHWLWCASRQAYYRMVNLDDTLPRDEQIAQIPWKLNPWRECIDGQIRGDAWGYFAPGDPITAAKTAYRDCSFSLAKNGCYGGMFVSGCIAAALTQNTTVERILRGGLSVIPAQSRLAEAVRTVWHRYNETKDWIKVCGEIEERYVDEPFSGTINNLSMTVLALLHGNLDYTETITTAVMCGIDTDCNSGTAGSICGAAVGIDGIEPRWYEPFNDTVSTTLLDFGANSITNLIRRITAIGKKHFNSDSH